MTFVDGRTIFLRLAIVQAIYVSWTRVWVLRASLYVTVRHVKPRNEGCADIDPNLDAAKSLGGYAK